jgi:drug/metabolite transporter (DMT)-like permease
MMTVNTRFERLRAWARPRMPVLQAVTFFGLGTVILAWLELRERLAPVQVAGVGLALAGEGLIAGG